MINVYDLVFVGSGLSCSYTLRHFLHLLKQAPQNRTLKLLFLEKDEQFWTGVAYGNRSGYNSHIITALRHFIPAEEKKEFTDWLQKNSNWVFDDFKRKNGPASASWLNKNESRINNQEWDDVYLPRYIFGLFLKEKVASALQEATSGNLVTFELVTANVSAIEKHEGYYTIEAFESNYVKTEFRAWKVVLGIGSPPVRPSFNNLNAGPLPVHSIEDMYEPSMVSNIQSIETFLQRISIAGRKNILIIGSNASALEVICSLADSLNLRDDLDKIYVISTSGVFPNRINEKSHLSAYYPVNLSELKNNTDCTPAAIYEAIKLDIGEATSSGIDIDETYHPISNLLIDLVKSLDVVKKRQFVTRYGFEIGKLQRRAGADYLNVADKLIADGRLKLIKGKFVNCVQGEDGVKLRFYDSGMSFQTLDVPFSVLINCSGFTSLKETQSALINQLVNSQICKINSSDKGIVVNERFEANDNLFVMGPLLAGNIIGDKMVWHVESCNRIFGLSQCLAPYLLNSD